MAKTTINNQPRPLEYDMIIRYILGWVRVSSSLVPRSQRPKLLLRAQDVQCWNAAAIACNQELGARIPGTAVIVHSMCNLGQVRDLID